MWGLFFYLLIGLVFGYFGQKKLLREINDYEEKLESLMRAKNEKTDFEHRMMYRTKILEHDKDNEFILDCLKGMEMIGEDYFLLMTFSFFTLFWPLKAFALLVMGLFEAAMFIWYDVFKIGIDSHDDEEEDV